MILNRSFTIRIDGTSHAMWVPEVGTFAGITRERKMAFSRWEGHRDFAADEAAADAAAMRAFGGLTAAEAAEIILGGRMTADQVELLRWGRCAGGYSRQYIPAPAGHIAFRYYGTMGTGNYGELALMPATAECRRIVNAGRRKRLADRIAEFLPSAVAAGIADQLFAELRGYEPPMEAAIEAVRILSLCPDASDRMMRSAGLRPGHPHEGAGIRAARSVMR